MELETVFSSIQMMFGLIWFRKLHSIASLLLLFNSTILQYIYSEMLFGDQMTFSLRKCSRVVQNETLLSTKAKRPMIMENCALYVESCVLMLVVHHQAAFNVMYLFNYEMLR